MFKYFAILIKLEKKMHFVNIQKLDKTLSVLNKNAKTAKVLKTWDVMAQKLILIIIIVYSQ